MAGCVGSEALTRESGCSLCCYEYGVHPRLDADSYSLHTYIVQSRVTDRIVCYTRDDICIVGMKEWNEEFRLLSELFTYDNLIAAKRETESSRDQVGSRQNKV